MIPHLNEFTHGASGHGVYISGLLCKSPLIKKSIDMIVLKGHASQRHPLK